MQKEKNKVNITSLFRGIAIVMLIFIVILPAYWMLLTSFKGTSDILNMPPKFIARLTLENYKFVFGEAGFMKYIFNSLIVSITSTLLVMLIATPAAYSFARFDTGGGQLSFYILTTRMMPQIAVVIPYFLIFVNLRLIDTRAGLILAYTMFNLPVAIWLLQTFFKEIPIEIENSARVDGYTRPQILSKVVLPLIKPGMAVTSMLCLIYSWNEFLFAFILTRSHASTITVGISSFWTQRGILWGPLSAAAVVAIIPVIIFSMIFQKYIVRGLTFGAVKG